MTTRFRSILTNNEPDQPNENSKPTELEQSSQVLQNGAVNGDMTPADYQYRGVTYTQDKLTGTYKGKASPFIQWFYDLPVQRKQLLGLLTSEAISVMGLVGVSSILIITGGRALLLNQAKSELAVLETSYNIKINQMGSGFRGQADNVAIIEAARAAAANRPAPPEAIEQVKRILRNEVEAREIEYATLVGKNLRIIANANADRTGDKFDPNGIVGTVLANPRQIKTSEVVSWAELKNESPSLPEGFSDQDALIRYTFTPVNDPVTQEVIGVLISGDIVNNKLPIIDTSLAAFGSGYSAVYFQQDGQLSLASSKDLASRKQVEQGQVNVPLPDTALLEKAVAAGGQPVAQRIKMGNETYTVAAKVLLNFNEQPVAILVRGTSEVTLNRMLRDSLLLQMAIAGVAIIANILLAVFLGRTIARPIHRLQQTARRVSEGDRTVRAEVLASDEIGRLTISFNHLVDTMMSTEARLNEQNRRQQIATERVQLLAEVTSKIRRSLDFNEILSTSVDGVRDVLKVDRVVIYRFNPDFKGGYITAESVGRGWIRALGQNIYDPLVPGAIERFKTGRVSIVENLSDAKLSDCHCEILRRLEVQANMVAPVMVGEELIGLLCAHQCSGPRKWDQAEVELIQQLSTQIGYALSQATLLRQQSQAALREQQLNGLVTRMRESLDRDKIFRTVVTGAREVLAANRVIVYVFNEKWEGTIVSESVQTGYPSALGATIADPCFADRYVEKYRQGRVQATANIYEANLTDCHLRQLEPFQVKANLVAPILFQDNLMGLLIAHQCSGPRTWEDNDINFIRQMAVQLGFALEQSELFAQKEKIARLERQLNEIVTRMRETLDRERIFRAVVNGLRESLQANRSIVYLFDEQWQGTVVAESIEPIYPAALGSVIVDPCFADSYVEKYRKGRVQATKNIYEAGLSPCHIKILEPFQVKANIVAPILAHENLLGLLIAHQCSTPRAWEDSEINFIRQLAIQLGFALEQSELFSERERVRQQAEELSEEQRQQKEALQRQLVELLGDIEGASRGDLTVRAEVTAGEIGTVADFFNSIIESLRQIVIQVKQSSMLVNQSLGENEGSIRELAETAITQAEETTRTLASVEQMTQSIFEVAENARQAAEVARTASATVATGSSAMDLTVKNILNLRETFGETAKKVKRLGEASQQISKVVSLINQIAMQTNLLAINAGIEAARAGEEGQGFAVVAEEVGELAARSSAATQEIEKIVDNIQRETSQVVEAMEQSTTQVVEGTYLVEDAKQSLSRILEVSQQIDELVQYISAATVSQVETSETVANLMRQIAQVSERTSESSLQVSTALQQTVEIAQELQASVGAFETGV